MVGILFNPSALAAQNNLQKASADGSKLSAQISGGERIIEAADDVAGLAIGTILQTNVRTLQAALGNSSQAKSVLGVVDGGLKNISDILQRMKTLTSTAASGSLDNNTRAFVNAEFQQLSTQIDDIAGNTEFNGRKLLDGSIFSPTEVKTKTQTSGVGAATSASNTLTVAAALTDANAGLSINGVTFTARATADLGLGFSALNLDTGASASQQRDAIINGYNTVVGYTGDNQGILDAQNKLREVKLISSGTSDIIIESRTAGAIGNDILVGGVGGHTAASLTLGGTDVSNAVVGLSPLAANGALNGGQSENLTASGTVNVTSALTAAGTGVFIFSDGGTDTISLDAVATSTAYDALASDDKWRSFDITTHATGDEQAQAIATKLNDLKFYEGNTATLVADSAIAKKFDFIAQGDKIKIVSKEQGTVGNNATVDISGTGLAADVDGESIVSGTAVNLTSNERGTYITANLLAEGKRDGFSASGTLKMNSAVVATDAVSINGATFTFVAGAPANDREVDITGLTTTASQMLALNTAVTNVLNYTGTDSTTIAAREALENVDVSLTTSYLRVTAKDTGSSGNSVQIATNTTTASDFALNGENFAAGAQTKDLSTNIRGTYVQDRSTTFAKGVVRDSIIKELNSIGTNTSTGIDVSKISNNKDFVGKIGSNGTLSGTFAAADRTNLNFEIGGINYAAANVNTNVSTDTEITFASDNAGSFKITLAANEGVAVNNAADSQTFVRRLSDAIDQVSVIQRREISSYIASGNIVPSGSTTSIGNLNGSSFDLENDDFSGVVVEDIKIVAPGAGAANASFTVKIDGENYTNNNFGKEVNAGSSLTLVNENDPLKRLYFNNGSTKLDLGQSQNAIAAEEVFKNAFGLGQGGGNISFQVGATASEVIEIGVSSVKTSDIFIGSDGASTNLSLNTATDAVNAGTTIDGAIQKVVAIRAGVGALQSRFNFVSSTLTASIQNQDAARSSLLDTDIALSSTEFSKAQVRTQGSISMLAQANQLTQALLKLMG